MSRTLHVGGTSKMPDTTVKSFYYPLMHKRFVMFLFGFFYMLGADKMKKIISVLVYCYYRSNINNILNKNMESD